MSVCAYTPNQQRTTCHHPLANSGPVNQQQLLLFIVLIFNVPNPLITLILTCGGLGVNVVKNIEGRSIHLKVKEYVLMIDS